ncbi:MAG: hypothetical protein GYB65_11435 [Chloroflexi bacterium]|nr:hypothetical protein [Chloroflexota bacterium]
MNPLLDRIMSLTSLVLSGEHSLDDALQILEDWLADHADSLTPENRATFRAALDGESTNDDRSLIDSILKLHTARVLHRQEAAQLESDSPDPDETPYQRARRTFSQALAASEDAINDVRIDVAVANAHSLLGDIDANRRWLDHALTRLTDIAATDLVTIAQDIPPMTPPKMNWIKRASLRFVGFDFNRLAQDNLDTLVKIAHLQTNQITILSHLIGVSFVSLEDDARARRAFRATAHLIIRHDGMPFQDNAPQLLDVAESLHLYEMEAAQVLAQQALALCETEGDEEECARAEALLAV